MHFYEVGASFSNDEVELNPKTKKSTGGARRKN